MGIDDLRVLHRVHKKKTLIPVLGGGHTLDILLQKVPHLFAGTADGFYPPVLECRAIDQSEYGQFLTIGDITFRPFEQDHGSCTTLGLRFADTAYSPDMVTLEEEAIDTLKGVRTWLVDGAGYHWNDNPAHASLEKIYALNEIIGAERVILMHLSAQMDYATLKAELPAGYEPAYDGLEVEIVM
jgi:phosphoribosyl 1,2-cyclic phosphate phosphodiesterase